MEETFSMPQELVQHRIQSSIQALIMTPESVISKADLGLTFVNLWDTKDTLQINLWDSLLFWKEYAVAYKGNIKGKEQKHKVFYKLPKTQTYFKLIS